MPEHLSQRVDMVVNLAEQIARQYEQEYVGTEHILLAISREGSGLGWTILKENGIDQKKLKDQIDQLVQRSMEDTWVFGRLPGSPHYRNVIAKAIEEARRLHTKEVCTEHLLLGLLAEEGSLAQQALGKLGLELDQVRRRVKEYHTAQ